MNLTLIDFKITDVTRRMEAGFNKGRMTLEGLEEFTGQKWMIEFQNENLIVKDLDTGKVK